MLEVWKYQRCWEHCERSFETICIFHFCVCLCEWLQPWIGEYLCGHVIGCMFVCKCVCAWACVSLPVYRCASACVYWYLWHSFPLIWTFGQVGGANRWEGLSINHESAQLITTCQISSEREERDKEGVWEQKERAKRGEKRRWGERKERGEGGRRGREIISLGAWLTLNSKLNPTH